MEEEEVVYVKVFDEDTDDVVFEGKVSTDITPDELVFLGCFWDQNAYALRENSTRMQVLSFKGMNRVELRMCCFGFQQQEFCGVLYVDAEDGVLRKSKNVPSCECVMMAVWNVSWEESEKVFQCETLQVLEMSRCEVSHATKGIGKLTKLKMLVLHMLLEEGMESIFEEGHFCSSLKELRIGYCHIEYLPKSIGSLKQLEKLSLMTMTQLQQIPEEMGQMSNLKELLIEECGLKCLPQNVSMLHRLEKVDLSRMWRLKLRGVEDIGVLSKLKHLRIVRCDKLFQLESSTFAAFCEMLKKNVNLQTIEFNVEEKERVAILEALRENGSIVEARGNGVDQLTEVLERNKVNRERAMESVMCMMALRRTRRAMVDTPKEIVEMIGKMLWITRCDCEAWKGPTSTCVIN